LVYIPPNADFSIKFNELESMKEVSIVQKAKNGVWMVIEPRLPDGLNTNMVNGTVKAKLERVGVD
jgi:hypothetical protein